MALENKDKDKKLKIMFLSLKQMGRSLGFAKKAIDAKTEKKLILEFIENSLNNNFLFIREYNELSKKSPEIIDKASYLLSLLNQFNIKIEEDLKLYKKKDNKNIIDKINQYLNDSLQIVRLFSEIFQKELK